MKRLVVLVEDDRDDEALARLALERSGVEHRLIVVRDGAEALVVLLSGENLSPSLVLLDLKMPRMGGLELLGRLRAHGRTRHVPVVVFTSSSEERDVAGSYERGANAYVRKPIDFDDYSVAVAHIGAFWLERNVLPGSLP